MKIFNNIIIAAAVILLTMGCSLACQQMNSTETTENYAFELETSKIEASAQGEEFTINITSPKKVNVVGLCDWCKTKTSIWEKGHSTLTLTVSNNDSYESRTQEFGIICESEKLTITVKQSGKEYVPIEENDAVKLARRMGMGWNLGNQFDAYTNGVSSETCWGNPKCTKALFDNLASYGFKTVRIPITWQGHIGSAPSYTLDKAWLDRIAEVLSYAKSAGLMAIINVHHDREWLDIVKLAKDDEVSKEIRNRYAALWKQVAERFRNEGDWLIFESYNELHDGAWGNGTNRTDGGAQYRAINSLAQLFVDSVRATGGENANRYLGVGSYVANPWLAMEQLVLPKDSATNKLMVSVHCYDPSGYCLGQNSSYTEWGHTGASGKKDPNHNEESLKELFNALKETYVLNNIPVYIGESGCVNREGTRARAFQKYYLEYFYKVARESGIPAIIWDNGSKGRGEECFGFLNHADGSYINDSKELIDAMRKASYTEDTSYTLETIYNQAP